MLNHELSSSRLKWALLPPSLFPNGFVYFFRPVQGMERPFLVHANWLNGIQEKLYHLQESGLWAEDGLSKPVQQGRYLLIGDHEHAATIPLMGFPAHRRALRDALDSTVGS